MGNKKFLTTGQFAELCGTTKETLFHYDRTGILKPKYVSANGYRRYLAEQFFEFDLIWVLKEAGSSLQDIKGYLAKVDVEHFLATLDEKALRLREQQRHLAERLEMLEHILKVTRSALTDDYGRIKVERRQEEQLIVSELNLEKGQKMSWDDTAEYLSGHFNLCASLGVTVIFPVGSIIPASSLQEGVFTESHFFSPAGRPVPDAHSLIKPEGDYATILHRGGYDRLIEDLPGFIVQMEKRGLEVIGRAYIYALLSYFSSKEEENDVHRIEIQVC